VSVTDPGARQRAPMTYEMVSWRAYGYPLAALVSLGSATSAEIAAFLAERETPHDGSTGGALGLGWYPMSVARIMTQIQKHHYPVQRDPDTGRWSIGRTSAAQRAAMCECFRLCAIDGRPRMRSVGN
jgi:hypothetical protein